MIQVRRKFLSNPFDLRYFHDVGGKIWSNPSDLQLADNPIQYWEKQVHATLTILCKKECMTTDELRRGIEQLSKDQYEHWSYYHKWAASILNIQLERKNIAMSDITDLILPKQTSKTPFQPGEKVQVRHDVTGIHSLFPKPHLRTPGYLFGAYGIIQSIVGKFKNPELLAFSSNQEQESQYLYRIRFTQIDLWEQYNGLPTDTVDVDIYHHWLLPESLFTKSLNPLIQLKDGHESRTELEQKAIDTEGEEQPGERVADLLHQALLKRGILTKQELQKAMENFDTMGSQKQGAHLVVRAWRDSEFKNRLLRDGNKAANELGILASNAHTYTKLIVVENSDKVHNLVVCTLCSCYPLSLLGPSPSWYKSRSYRARAVREPRKLLEDFGTVLPKEQLLRVHDSTADCRYLVLPIPPSNFEQMTDEELESYATRDRMIGVLV